MDMQQTSEPPGGQPTAREFRITFGLRYRYDVHPHFPQAHPDGWLTIVARDEEIARQIAHVVLDFDWAGIYAGPFDEDAWRRKHPAGEITRIDASLAAAMVPA
jgi:hypothetical protein